MCSSDSFATTLTKLVQLAPTPPSMALPLKKTQAILVTHYSSITNNCNKSAILESSNGVPAWALEEDTSDTTPTPAAVSLPESVCLHVVSGNKARSKNDDKDASTVTVVHPGSLRRHGEYSVVTMGLVPGCENGGQLSSVEWSVVAVDRYQLDPMYYTPESQRSAVPVGW